MMQGWAVPAVFCRFVTRLCQPCIPNSLLSDTY